MGMTHRDFFRTFPAVAKDVSWTMDGDTVVMAEKSRRLSIHMGSEGQRRIAGLTLPTVDLRFEFQDYDEEEADSFMARFDLAFRRGGG